MFWLAVDPSDATTWKRGDVRMSDREWLQAMEGGYDPTWGVYIWLLYLAQRGHGIKGARRLFAPRIMTSY